MAERLLQSFFDFVRIPSESGKEDGFLDHIGGILKREFRADCLRDSFGNLVARIPGRNTNSMSPILLGFHADTVSPGMGIKPIIDGTHVRSSGETILGADDKAGIAEALEALRRADRFPPLEMVITREEEHGLLGARNLDFSLLRARKGYVLDMDSVESIVVGGPSKIDLDIAIRGKAAHAGMEPEKGVSAIRAAAFAIADIPDGRIDACTTCNIGTIAGGENRNSVPERVSILAEVRSLDNESCLALGSRMKEAFERKAFSLGASAEIHMAMAYQAYSLADDSDVVLAASSILSTMGLAPRVHTIVGGTDSSIYNEHGIACAVLGTGACNEHTTEEYISIADMQTAVELVLALFRHFA